MGKLGLGNPHEHGDESADPTKENLPAIREEGVSDGERSRPGHRTVDPTNAGR